mmetsp:Transcript_1101/g.2189  ORF Transcript_1101/g.2189 Transcript_1101/m.2189 type:complete len:518 (+) Transcript_1101:218-1771(+)
MVAMSASSHRAIGGIDPAPCMSPSGDREARDLAAVGSGSVGCHLFGFGDHVVDTANHVERTFGQVIVFTGNHRLEGRDGVFQLHLDAVGTGEDFRHVEGLRKETLDLAGTGHDQFVLFREFVHAENGDDVLQRLVALEDTLDVTGHLVVLFTNDGRIHQARGAVERVHGRVDAKLGDRTRQNCGGVEVGEGCCRRGVGKVVRGNVDGLDRGDRAALRGGNTLLHGAHVGGQRRLVAHSRRNTSQKGGHFGTGLREAEDVVDEEQHVCAGRIAELLGDGQAGQGDPHTRTGRLVHLAVNQRDLRLFEVIGNDNAGFDHLVVEVVALTGPLTHTGEHGHTGVHLRDVVDQFHDENGLAHAGTAEEADLTTLGVGREKVDDLDAGHEDFGLGGLVGELGRVLVNAATLVGGYGAAFVHGLAHDVEDPAEGRVTDRHADRAIGVGHFLTAHETFGRVHRDGTDGPFAKVLSNLKNQALAVVLGFESVENLRQVFVELHVNDSADDLRDFTDCISHVSCLRR